MMIDEYLLNEDLKYLENTERLMGQAARKALEKLVGCDVIKDVIVEIIEELQSSLREGDRLTITPKSARLVCWGELKALGVDVVAVFLAREG